MIIFVFMCRGVHAFECVHAYCTCKSAARINHGRHVYIYRTYFHLGYKPGSPLTHTGQRLQKERKLLLKYFHSRQKAFPDSASSLRIISASTGSSPLAQVHTETVSFIPRLWHHEQRLIMRFSDTVKLDSTLSPNWHALVQYLAHEALIDANQCRESMTVNILIYKINIWSFLWCGFIWYDNNLMIQNNTLRFNFTVYQYTLKTGNTGKYRFLFWLWWVFGSKLNELSLNLSLLILVLACLSLVFHGPPSWTPPAGPPKALNFPFVPSSGWPWPQHKLNLGTSQLYARN